jgi:hypothetical protein
MIKQLAESNPKFKKDFEWYLINRFKCKNILRVFSICINGFWIPWYSLDPSMQIGVLIDFFSLVDIEISFWKDKTDDRGHLFYINRVEQPPLLQTKDEIRKAAIEKAVEIYEGRN